MLSTEISPQVCPLCGQANQCAVATGLPAESCWCMQTRIPPEVLERVAPEQRNKACVCPACGQAAVTNKLPGVA